VLRTVLDRFAVKDKLPIYSVEQQKTFLIGQ